MGGEGVHDVLRVLSLSTMQFSRCISKKHRVIGEKVGVWGVTQGFYGHGAIHNVLIRDSPIISFP